MEAILVIEGKDKDGASADEQIAIYVRKFKVVPVGSRVVLYDKKKALLDDEGITGYTVDNTNRPGMVVRFLIEQHNFDRLMQVCELAKQTNWATHEYPRRVSMRER
jgi:hypothetical protein